METNGRGKIAGGLLGLAAGMNPLRSSTFLLALGVTAVSAWVWFRQSGEPRPPFPTWGIVAASYAGGFLIGRVFWKGVKIAILAAFLLLAALALLNRAHVDTAKASEAVEAGSSWVQAQAGRATDHLLQLLPSGGAAAVGVLLGGRRKRIRAKPEAAG